MPGSDDAAFRGADMSTKLKLLGVDVASIGDAHAATPGAKAYSFNDERRQVYKKLVVDADGKRLLGGVLVGDAADYGTWLQMMLNSMALPEFPEELLVPKSSRSSAPTLSATAALPDTAQICQCNNVSKGALCAAIDAGCTTVGALKTKTKAATACGGCAPLVTQILKAELARKGVAVDNHLCEHFRTRASSSSISCASASCARSTTCSTKHGRGRGCDICKPAVASILASCWNEFVLAREHAAPAGHQ